MLTGNEVQNAAIQAAELELNSSTGPSTTSTSTKGKIMTGTTSVANISPTSNTSLNTQDDSPLISNIEADISFTEDKDSMFYYRITNFCDFESLKPQHEPHNLSVGPPCSVTPLKQADLHLAQATRHTLALIDYPYLFGQMACSSLLSELHAIALSQCQTIQITIGVPKRMTEKERDLILPLMVKGFTKCASECGASVTGAQIIVNPWLYIGGTASAICKSTDYISGDQAQAGDVLVLTKPLGTFIALHSFHWIEQPDRWNRVRLVVNEEEVRKAYLRSIDVMCRTNLVAAHLLRKYAAHAAININDCGLLGHAEVLSKRQKNCVKFVIHNLPVLAKMATLAKACGQLFPLTSGYCPESAGGILACLPREQAANFCKEIEEQEGYSAWIIGIVEKGERSARIIDKPRIIEVPMKDTETSLCDAHTEFGTCIAWLDQSHLISAGDDHQLIIWSLQPIKKQRSLQLPDDFFPTCLTITSAFAASQIGIQIGIGSSDGHIILLSMPGDKFIKHIQCHQAAVTSVQFSEDGSAILTSSEDGQVKIWSRSTGLLRWTLATHTHPVHCALFATAPSQTAAVDTNPIVAYTYYDQLILASLAPNAQPYRITLHEDSVIRILAFCPQKKLLVTADECGCIRIFNSQGKSQGILHKLNSPASAVSWSVNGEYLAVASHGKLLILHRSGDIISLQHVSSLVRQVVWSNDNRRLALLQIDGRVALGELLDIYIEWAQYSLFLQTGNTATLSSATSGFEQQLDFAGMHVNTFQMQHGKLLVLLDEQVQLYTLSEESLGAGASLTLNSKIQQCVMASNQFALIDTTGGCVVYDYQCRKLQIFKTLVPSHQTYQLTAQNISLNSAFLILLDGERTIRLFHVGKEPNRKSAITFVHRERIECVSVCDVRPLKNTLIAFLDENRDLYVLRVDSNGHTRTNLVLNACSLFLWHEKVPMLACIQQTSVQILYCPLSVFTDAHLMNSSVSARRLSSTVAADCVQLQYFVGGFVQVSLANNLRFPVHINPLSVCLYENILHGPAHKWEKTQLLMRGSPETNNNILWSIYTCMALLARDIQSAESGYAAMLHTDKVLYLQRLVEECNQLESAGDVDIAAQVRSSEIALLCGDDWLEVETYLIRAGLPIRLIIMHVQLFNWKRALEVASKCDQQINQASLKPLNLESEDTSKLMKRLLLTHRIDYLSRFGKKETIQEYKVLQDEVEPLEEDILEKVQRNQYNIRIKLKI